MRRLRFLHLYLVIASICIMTTSSWAGELVLDGVILDRSNRYDGYPVHLLVDGIHHMWFCGQSPVTNADAIYHATHSGSLRNTSGWSEPEELFNIQDVPWALEGGGVHVCDPTVLRGDFIYEGTSYPYAMYFTSDTTSAQTGQNAIGVAFSHDGISWVIHPEPVILPQGGFDGSYGAGASGVAWGPEAGIVHQVYRDSTTSFGDFRIRYQSATDGLIFSPNPSLDTQLSAASPSGLGSAPEIAFLPRDGRWYATIQNVAGGDPFTGRILQAQGSEDLFSSWTTIQGLEGGFAGEELLILPSLAKNETSTLFVDAEGWIYVFFTAGNLPGNSPGVLTWKIMQARYRLFDHDPGVLEDTFTQVSPLRAHGRLLSGTDTELGARTWQANSSFVFSDGSVTVDESFSDARFGLFPLGSLGGTETVLEASLDIAGSEWSAVGFSSNTSSNGLFDGEIWVLLHNLTQEIFVFADGLNHELLRLPVGGFPPGWQHVRLKYDHLKNSVSIRWNGDQLVGEPIQLSNVGFVPSLDRAGFHVFGATSQLTRIDDIRVNPSTSTLIFADGFESGDVSRWSASQ